MNEGKRKNNGKKAVIMLFILSSIVVTVFFSSYFITKEMEIQLQQSLEDVANQNALALYNKIHSNHQLLLGLSDQMKGIEEQDIPEKLSSFSNLVQSYGLKRFAYALPNGTSYATDGGTANLSFREFFKRGMEGKGTISGVLHDALEEQHGQVNVMTIPIFGESGTVEGVFGLTYKSQSFNDALQVECFEGKGYSCAISETGEVMVAMGKDELKLSENFFSDELGENSKNDDEILHIKEMIEEKKVGGGLLYLDEKVYYYCTPVRLMDGDVTWYMLTIVPAAVLESRVEPVRNHLYLMVLVVTICIFLGILFFFFVAGQQQKTILRYAYEDPLTLGPNYAKFCLEMRKKRSRSGYMVTMDIMNFNNINIVAGKNAGDIAIGQIWNIIQERLQYDELAGHVREDVYVLFLRGYDKDILVGRLNDISSAISKIAIDMQVKGIHAQYGVYEMKGMEKLEDAYSKAQIAREHARSQKELHCVFYDEIDHARLQENQLMEERFEEAIAGEEFEVWYQPKYSVATRQIVGSEALVRWREKDGTMISPGRFIPLFEQNGMIAKLDEYMFRSVCRQQAEWIKAGEKIYPVSINLSRASLYQADIVDRYLGIIEENNISTSCVQLEITESTLEGKVDIRKLLENFRNKGIQILMDDFGTGYSSLSTLNMRCFDTLKLDKSLIDHIGEEKGETLLKDVIGMGHHLGLYITAEGVEQEKQLAFLQENQCDDIQGFLFAKPMPKEEFETLMSKE